MQEPVGLEYWEDLDLPDVPDLDEGSFRNSLGVLDGLESYTHLMPAASSETTPGHGFVQTATPPHEVAAAEHEVAQPSTAEKGGRTERNKFSNRMSQKRFRQRQKDRTAALESELAKTSAQLEHLQSMQTAITAKNKLLEKLLQLNKQADTRTHVELTKTVATVQDLYKQHGFKTVSDPMFAASQTVPTLRLSIWGQGKQSIPVQEIGQLGLKEFARIYTAYVHQMATSLAQLTKQSPTERKSCPAMQHVQELVIECCSLLVIALMSNPSLYKDLQHCNFEDGQTCPEEQTPTAYCDVMAAMQYTEAQIQDLLHLRCLFINRLGQLARERKTLLENMASCKMDSSHVCDRLDEVKKWSELLRENGAEEHRSYMQIITASCRGLRECIPPCNVQVSTRHQLATGLVCAFPWPFRMSELVKAEAIRRGLPSKQEIIQDTSITDLQHAANWAEVVLYLEGITEHDLDVHVPFLRPEAHHQPDDYHAF